MIAWFLRKWRHWRDPHGERQILAKYSTPGLKRSELSRYGKMWHLRECYRMTPEEREKLLSEMYPDARR
jgi:hypothetical protein